MAVRRRLDCALAGPSQQAGVDGLPEPRRSAGGSRCLHQRCWGLAGLAPAVLVTHMPAPAVLVAGRGSQGDAHTHELDGQLMGEIREKRPTTYLLHARC